MNVFHRSVGQYNKFNVRCQKRRLVLSRITYVVCLDLYPILVDFEDSRFSASSIFALLVVNFGCQKRRLLPLPELPYVQPANCRMPHLEEDFKQMYASSTGSFDATCSPSRYLCSSPFFGNGITMPSNSRWIRRLYTFGKLNSTLR